MNGFDLLAVLPDVFDGLVHCDSVRTGTYVRNTDDTDNDKYGYNYAHVLEHGGAHKNWGKSAKALPARPFLGPAGDAVHSKNVAIMNDMLEKWAIGQ